MVTSAIWQAASHLHSAKSVLVLTGAGISKESGIPTYREAQSGEWAHFDPEVLATPDGFHANPKLVWAWNEYRRLKMLEAQPNLGHIAIANLEQLLPSVTVLTQNIDGLHQRAGSQDVIELHGNIYAYKCSRNCYGNPTRFDLAHIEKYSHEGIPVCPRCGAYIRHDIVWFHERLSPNAIHRAWELLQSADILIVVGTSGLISPAAGFPSRAKQANNTYVIEVNPSISALTHEADIHIPEPAGNALPQLVAHLRTLM